LQHLVNICESTKAIIQIITSYSSGAEAKQDDNVPEILETTMKEVLNLQKHLMRFTIDCYKTHKTEATTLDLYGEHFGDDSQDNKTPEGESINHLHHIAKNSDSDDYFLEDDGEEVFSSLLPESVKQKKNVL
jgi:hypothetical protein